MDLQLFYLINQFAGNNPLLDQCMILLSEYGATVFVLLLGGIWLLRKRDGSSQHAVLFALLAIVLALGFNQVIGYFYFRPRPFVLNDVSLLILKSAESNSFPSNHAAGAFAIAFVFLWQQRILGILLLGLAVLLALSRIYVGVHYPLDILAGTLLALLATVLVYWQRETIVSLIQRFTALLPSKAAPERGESASLESRAKK